MSESMSVAVSEMSPSYKEGNSVAAGVIVLNKDGEVLSLLKSQSLQEKCNYFGFVRCDGDDFSPVIFPSRKIALESVQRHWSADIAKGIESYGISSVEATQLNDFVPETRMGTLAASFGAADSIRRVSVPEGPLVRQWKENPFSTALSVLTRNWSAQETPGFTQFTRANI